MNSNTTNEWVIAGLFAIIIALTVLVGFFPKWSLSYKEGVIDTKREAFKHGFMTKEVNEKDEVIYRWIEAHKYNEQ